MTTIYDYAKDNAPSDIHYYIFQDAEPQADRPHYGARTKYGNYGYFMPATGADAHRPPSELYYLPDGFGSCDLCAKSVALTNARAFWEEFQKVDGVLWLEGGHGTFQIAIRCDVENEAILDMLGAVADYPVVDDMALSAVETEAQDEEWSNWASGDFQSRLKGKYSVELWEVPDEKLKEYFEMCRERANEYWFEESSGGWCINMKAIVEKAQEEEVVALPGAVKEDPCD